MNLIISSGYCEESRRTKADGQRSEQESKTERFCVKFSKLTMKINNNGGGGQNGLVDFGTTFCLRKKKRKSEKIQHYLKRGLFRSSKFEQRNSLI